MMKAAGTLTAPSCPRLSIAPVNPSEVFFRSAIESTPSPMTFVASLLVENDPYSDIKSFSQLLNSTMSPNQTNMDTKQASLRSNDGNSCHNANETQANNTTARYKSLGPAKIPISSTSPMSSFMIPPGLSPAMLLESPILFNAGQVIPSPTTGSFFPMARSAPQNEFKGMEQNDSFIFKPNPDQMVKTEMPQYNNMDSNGRHDQHQPARPSITSSPDRVSCLSYDVANPVSQQWASHSQPPAKQLSEAFVPEQSLPDVNENSCTEDGYNWKKYGQKQLKGTEQPRSYYKCTHPDCPVRKYIECSYEGVVTKIVYKGEHNHEKPKTLRRTSRNSIHSIDRSVRVSHTSSATNILPSSRRADQDKLTVDISSSSLVASESCLEGTPEPSFCSPDDSDDDNDDEHESKRRKIDNMSSHPTRVIIQTVSQVDVLDDGYRWRKYGQKIVKGHIYPRSYYRCTNSGCSVRKHVERCSSDSSSVQTTYEGKHNHGVPPERGSAQ